MGPGAAGAPTEKAGVLNGVVVAMEGVVGMLRGALVGCPDTPPLLPLLLLPIPLPGDTNTYHTYHSESGIIHTYYLSCE